MPHTPIARYPSHFTHPEAWRRDMIMQKRNMLLRQFGHQEFKDHLGTISYDNTEPVSRPEGVIRFVWGDDDTADNGEQSITIDPLYSMALFMDIPNNPYLQPLGIPAEEVESSAYSGSVAARFFDYQTYFPNALADTRLESPNLAIRSVNNGNIYLEYDTGLLYNAHPDNGGVVVAGSAGKKISSAIHYGAGGAYFPPVWTKFWEDVGVEAEHASAAFVIYEDQTWELVDLGSSFTLLYAVEEQRGNDTVGVVRTVGGSIPKLKGVTEGPSIRATSERQYYGIPQYFYIWGIDSYIVYTSVQIGYQAFGFEPAFFSAVNEFEGKLLYADGPIALLENGELRIYELNNSSAGGSADLRSYLLDTDVVIAQPFFELSAGAVDSSAPGVRWMRKDGSWRWSEAHNDTILRWSYPNQKADWQSRLPRWYGVSRFDPVPKGGGEFPDYYGLEASRGINRSTYNYPRL